MVVSFRGWLPLAGLVEMPVVRAEPSVEPTPAVDLIEEEWAAGLDVHQHQGARFLTSRDGALLGDEMGLGKTRTMLAALRLLRVRSVLIVCPAGIREVWSSEVRAIFPASVECHLPSPSEQPTVRPGVTIVAYSRLAAMASSLAACSFEACVFDEAQFIKNAGDSKAIHNGDAKNLHRTEAAFIIAKGIPRVYALTGTPILSRTRELFNLLAITRHPLGRNFKKFADRYCDGHFGPFGYVADGISNAEELRSRLDGWYLARKKVDVFPNMPKKVSRLKRVTLSPIAHDIYATAWRDYLNMLRADAPLSRLRNVIKASHLTRLGVLRQLVSKLKAPTAFEIAAAHPGKVVVIAAFSETIKELVRLAPKGSFVVYKGDTTEDKRTKAVKRFQNDPTCRYFFGTAEPAKTGITLTAANLVIQIDFLWTPSDHAQIEDRAHRRGQEKDVTCLYLACSGTIDDQIIGLLAAKRGVIDSVLGSKDGSETESAKKVLLAAIKAEKDIQPELLKN